jgi:hypothetical protein
MWILSPIKTIYASLIYTAAYKWGESILPNIPTEAKPTDILGLPFYIRLSEKAIFCQNFRRSGAGNFLKRLNFSSPPSKGPTLPLPFIFMDHVVKLGKCNKLYNWLLSIPYVGL